MIKRKDQNLSTPCNANFAMGTLNWSFALLATCTERFHFLAVGRISFYARVSRNFTSPNTVSIDARDHVVLKILAIDKDSYYNEFYLYQHLEKIGAWAVPLIVTDETDGGNGHTDTTLKTMAIIMKKLEA